MEQETQSIESTVSTPSTPDSSEQLQAQSDESHFKGHEPDESPLAETPEKPKKPQTLKDKIQARVKASDQAKKPKTEKPSAPVIPADASAQAKPADPAAQADPAAVTQSKDPYAPNFKFKVANQEREMDEWIRQMIKDPETEKKARELFEKAHGLDYVKPKLLQEREAHKQTREQFTQTQQTVQQALALRDTDLGGFFEFMKIPRDKLFQYVRDELNYLQAPPEQQREIDLQRDRARQVRELSSQNQQLSQGQLETEVHARTLELNSVLAKPEIKSIADDYNARKNDPNGFFNLVAMVATTAFYNSNGQVDMSPEEAVQEALNWLAYQRPEAQAQPNVTAQPPATPAPQQMSAPAPQVPPAQAAPAPAPAPAQKPPVIPAIQGRSASPTRQPPRSIKDLKKLAQSMGPN
jgi:hypothetical protein